MNVQLNILVRSFAISMAELRSVYTWRTWIFGWLLRLMAQVSYFAMIGGLVGAQESMRYVLIGNIVFLPCLEATIVIMSVAGERLSGTLPLLVVSPTSHVPIYLGRGVQWLATGFASSVITLLVVPPMLDIAIPPEDILPVVSLLLLVGLSSYCYGSFLAGVGLRRHNLNWVLLNLSYITVMTFCGVNVPVDFWPGPVRALANVLPVTHGLEAVRGVLDDAPVTAVLSSAALELAVGVGWLLIAVLSLDRLISQGRLDGSLDHGD